MKTAEPSVYLSNWQDNMSPAKPIQRWWYIHYTQPATREVAAQRTEASGTKTAGTAVPRSTAKPRGGSPGSSRERDTGHPTDSKAATRKEKRTLRCALQKAREVALRYTIEASAGMKAFDGPPLGPKNIKDLLLRNFRVKLSTPEAIALIAYFTKKGGRSDFGEPITIEHGEFLHAIRRLRREQLKKKEKRERKPRYCAALRRTGSESLPVNASSFFSDFRHDRHQIETHGQQPSIVDNALPKVNQAGPSYDPRRTESLPETDEGIARSSHALANTGINQSLERA
eukprot:jgi/Undpi1/1548/HiC_scaffold_11.g04938.m1